MPSILSEQEYNQVYRILSNHQHNNHDIISSIQRHVLPNLTSKNSFLDIGPGTGYITQSLQDQFSDKTVVDPSAEFCKHFISLGYHTVHGTFQDVHLTGSYDYILCSHVLYNVDLSEWPEFLTKIMHTLSVNGCATIVMSAGVGRHHDVCASINRQHKSSAQVIEYLHAHSIAFHVDTSESYYQTNSFDDMYALCRFTLLEDCFTPDSYAALSQDERSALDEKIKEYTASHRQHDGTYRLVAEVDIIHIPSIKPA